MFSSDYPHHRVPTIPSVVLNAQWTVSASSCARSSTRRTSVCIWEVSFRPERSNHLVYSDATPGFEPARGGKEEHE